MSVAVEHLRQQQVVNTDSHLSSGGSLLPALEQKQTDSDFKLFALVPHATTAAELQKLVACKVLVGDTSDNETMRRFILDHDSAFALACWLARTGLTSY